MIRSREKKTERSEVLTYLSCYHHTEEPYTVSASLDVKLHWTCPGWEPSKPCIKMHLSFILQHHEKQSTAPASMKWSYNLLSKKKDIVLWTLWLCAKRCFRSEEGHTASTNINARTSLPLQNKESTALYTSQLIKAVLFLEKPTCFSINIC